MYFIPMFIFVNSIVATCNKISEGGLNCRVQAKAITSYEIRQSNQNCIIFFIRIPTMKKTQSNGKNWQDSLGIMAEDIQACAEKMEASMFLSIVQVAIAVPRYWDTHAISKPVSRQGFRVLRCLISHGGRRTPTEIGREILLSKYTVTRIVDSLEKRGLVKREPFGDDLRTRDIIITNKGIALVNDCADYLKQHVMKQFLANLNQKQVDDIRAFLRSFRDYLLASIPDSSSKILKPETKRIRK
jgi:DNA-binding MarR family transcriptional regulator